MAKNNNSYNNINGYVAAGWENIRTVFEQNFNEGLDIGASVCIYYHGKCVVDLYGGWKDAEKTARPYTPDTMHVVFSASKGVMGAAVAVCVEKGWLSYDVPVARYWPEFAANGKQNITLTDVLSHRAGLPYVDETLTVDDVCNWSRMTSLLAAQKPHWEPGTVHGYHPVTTGFIIGELVHRVDPCHRSFGQFVRDEIDSGFHFGITNSDLERSIAPVMRKVISKPSTSPLPPHTLRAITCNGALPFEPNSTNDSIFNNVRLHQVEIPAANGISNARSLARIYARLIGSVHEEDQKLPRLVSQKTLLNATMNVTPAGEPDQILVGIKSKFGRGGFHLHSDYFNALGEGAFGHKGIGGSCGLAFPPQQLAFAYICNQLDFSVSSLDPRIVRLLDVVKNILSNEISAPLSSLNISTANPLQNKQTAS